ncbi:hypothetical protein [Endozoicomonas sp. 8E]|uniref:hypothetical protein n=1 Tax=Endozoicomonas sp. 8E TaxID=3035692 RepID=UPI0029392AEA|nr:hypothetical protein [Endozoicomonas sp. 8E]WOG28922.1 hypothetical protein P6910_04460 [Endozoicomonas sp. 8E]
MIIRKMPILFVAVLSISFSAILQAQEELVYVLWSLDSHAEMYLVQRLDNDEPRVLVSIKRDMYIDDAYQDHVGNIAYKRSRTDMIRGDYDPSRNAVAVARKMAREMLAEQKPVLAEKGIDPAKTPISFLYAVAGFDAVTAKEGDLRHKFFDPQDAIVVQEHAEKAIKETFQSSGIALTDIRTTHHTALIGEAMKLMNAEDELFVFKTTYDVVCSMEQGELKALDMKMLYRDDLERAAETPGTPMMIPKPVPSGGVHSLGAYASDKFFADAETSCKDTLTACQAKQTQWEEKLAQPEESMSPQDYREILSEFSACKADLKTCLGEEKLMLSRRYLKLRIDPEASDTEFFDRYTQRKRNNELGHKILLLRLLDAEAPITLRQWYADQMRDCMHPTLDQIEKRAASMIARAAEKGKSNPPNVYFLGEYAEMIETDFVNVIITEHLKAWGLTYSYINKQETEQLIVAGALRVIDSLRQANH